MKFRISEECEVVKEAPNMYLDTYKNQSSHSSATIMPLLQLKEGFTKNDVDSIIGNNSWTEHICDTCEEQKQELVVVREYSRTMHSSIYMCKTCLEKALNIL